MAHGTIWPALNRLYDGNLAGLLIEWADSGMSQMDVRDKIRDDFGITVSQTTVSRWYRRIHANATKAAS